MTINTWFEVRSAGSAVISAVIDGQAYTADDTHRNYGAIREALESGDEGANYPALFSLAYGVADSLSRISDRVALWHGNVTFDGDVIHTTLANAILEGVDRGEDIGPMALFLERLYENPSKHSRAMAYDWLTAQGLFTIDSEGYLLAYKGVAQTDEGYSSISSGTAFVNDVQKVGRIPQNIGDTVSMARSTVEHDPSVGCHVGLHVGTWDYASSWGHGTVLKVRVNPRDIVSVPTDCEYAKMRVSRYTVVEAIDSPMPFLVDWLENDELDEYEDDDEFDYDCGGW